VRESTSITDNLYNSYEALRALDIVPEEEMRTLSAWLEDLRA
jgi:hypothetical protein